MDKRKYWYRIDHYDCPVCWGHCGTDRMRVYDVKEAGTFYHDQWDYCEL